MEFSAPLVRGRLVKRYKRFLADVDLASGERVTAHCANPGAMLGVAPEGATVWLEPSSNPKRKLLWSWRLVEIDGALVGIDTSHPNVLAEEAVKAARIPELSGYATLRREVKYGQNSRIDLLLESPDRPPAYVEVKNVHLMREPGLAEFPDCVTARGAKHLRELADMVAQGARAVMLFIVQRTDCDRFALAADLDPAYAQAFATARDAGVEALVWACDVRTTGIDAVRPLPFAPISDPA